MEIVHDGWLTKSPPSKRIWKAKWRQRWFVLRHSGQLPGQFVLEYYTDSTCRKLKGKIDLDQCEQVDSGLAFENHHYMFDIKTPKRIYLLAAETEVDMNKWVDCICSVCGLKIHVEEEYSASVDQAITSLPGAAHSSDSMSLATPAPSTLSLASSRDEGSGPYILISECTTGQPIVNGSIPPRLSGGTSFPRNSPPPPPPKLGNPERALSGEFYDYPRPLNSLSQGSRNRTSPEPNLDDMYKVPPPLRNSVTVNSDWDCAFVDEDSWNHPAPPKVNWNTYPTKSLHTSSSVFTYDIVPSTLPTTYDVEARRQAQKLAGQMESLSLNDSGVDTQRSSSPQDTLDINACSRDSLQESGEPSLLQPPPRPPKPHHLSDKKRYENIELSIARSSSLSNYDTPPSAIGVFLSKNLPAQSFAFLRDENCNSDDLSPSTKVPLPLHSNESSQESCQSSTPDDMYDFPKMRSEDNLNSFVPLSASSSTLRRHQRHAYTNAPPGLFTSKESVFNYEYRPSLLSSDSYLTMDSQKADLYTDMSGEQKSPSSPTLLGSYANVPTSPIHATSSLTSLPPLVDRNLKPKRLSNGAGASTVLTLAPPPVSHSRATTSKRSFRKPRAGPHSLPGTLNPNPLPLPNRVRRRSDVSTSEDDLSCSGSSRRNSTNDDQTRHLIPPPPKKLDGEIQYLDLDLDSDTSAQSPRSPERLATSTVYKTVDFLKTKAFNETRQNVEETYRKSQ